MSNALVDDAGHPTERDESSPYNRGDHGGSVPFYGLGAEAEHNDPANEGVKKSGVEDFENEVDGQRREPGVVLRRAWVMSCTRHYEGFGE